MGAGGGPESGKRTVLRGKAMTEEVFDPELFKRLGLDYANGTVRTLNKTGYMRNHLCEISERFCAQQGTETETLLEIGCGIGVVLHQLVQQTKKKCLTHQLLQQTKESVSLPMEANRQRPKINRTRFLKIAKRKTSQKIKSN